MRDEDRRERERGVQIRLQRLNRALMLGFLSITAALIFWSIIRAPSILAREDNPRLVEAELRIKRGRILDRHGEIMAETIGPPDQLERSYPMIRSGPGVGYYSLRHGTSGIEESHDSLLRGESEQFWNNAWRRALHLPQEGRDVQISLDALLQNIAGELLDDETGAVLLLNLPDAEILAMVSHPGYDPNQLDALFEELASDAEAPLLNRATQGLYQPGMVLQPFLLAWAVDKQLIRLDERVENAGKPVMVNDEEVTCSSPHPRQASWRDMPAVGCPAPMADLAAKLGAAELDHAFAAFGLTIAPALPINTETADSDPVTDARLAGIGQESLTVTPLQVALAWMAIGMDGRLPIPTLVTATQDNEGKWQAQEGGQAFSGTAVSLSTARTLREGLSQDGEMIRFSALSLSGPEGNRNAWFLGLAPVESPQFAVVVVVENSDSIIKAEMIGRTVLESATAEE